MNTIATTDKSARLYTKGASEIVLGLCSTFLDKDGNRQKLTSEKKEELNTIINTLASEGILYFFFIMQPSYLCYLGLRTLSIAYKDLESADVDVDTSDKDKVSALEKDCVMVAIVGKKRTKFL